MYEVVTIGGATRDTFLISDHFPVDKDKLAFPWGEKFVVDEIIEDIGGGACNSAVGFSRLGFKTGFWGKVGSDANGEAIAKKLKIEGVSLQFLEIDSKAKTSFSVILADKSGEHAIVMYRGQNDDLLDENPDFNEITQTKWFYLTDVASTTEHLSLKIAEIAEKNKIKLAFIPGQHQLDLGLKKLIPVLKTAEIFILNAYEACKIAGEPFSKDATVVKRIIKNFSSCGAKIVVITMDKDGVWAFDRRDYYYLPAPSIKYRVDTTGAGDAFATGFVSAIMKEKPTKEAMSWGNQNAASVISHWGAQEGLLRKMI